jgi:hypothetical protein
MAEPKMIPAGSVIELSNHFDEQGKPLQIHVNEPISEDAFQSQLDAIMANWQNPPQAPNVERAPNELVSPVGSDTMPRTAPEAAKPEEAKPEGERLQLPESFKEAVNAAAPTIRGVGPIAAGALAGAALGAPIGGVGAIPGALAGAGAMALTELIGDPLIAATNATFGTRLSTPTEAWSQIFDHLGIPRSSTEASKIIEAVTHGVAGAAGWMGIGRSIAAGAARPFAGAAPVMAEASPAAAEAAMGAEGAAQQLPQGAQAAGELAGSYPATVAPGSFPQIANSQLARAASSELATIQNPIQQYATEAGYAAHAPSPLAVASQQASYAAPEAVATASAAQGAKVPFNMAAVGNELAANPGIQAIAGGASGGAGEASRFVAEKLGLGEKGQQAASLIGSLVGGAVAAKAASIRGFDERLPNIPGMTPDQVRQAIKEADAAGRKIFTSDIFRPKTKKMQLIQEVSEGTLFGTAEGRAAQEMQRKAHVQDYLNEVGAQVGGEAISDTMQSLRDSRIENVSTLSKIKNSIIENANRAGSGVLPKDLKRSLSEIGYQISELLKINKDINAPAIRLLENFRAGLVDIAYDINGKPIVSPKSLQHIDANLKLIGESLPNDQSVAHISALFDKASKPIYRALRKDIAEYIYKNAGKDQATQWARANNSLSESAYQLRSNALKSVLRTGDATPENVGKLLFSQKPSEVRLLVRNLDENGIKNAQAALVERALSKSLDAESLEVVPTRFAKNIQKLSKQIGLVFNETDKQTLDGLVNYLNLTRRAGEFNINPPTGARNVLPIVGGLAGSAAGGAVGGAIGLSTGGLSAQAFESNLVRKALTDFSKFKYASPEQFAAMTRVKDAINTAQALNYQEQAKKVPLSFQPDNIKEEHFSNGPVTTDTKYGYRLLPGSGNKVKLFGPNNVQIGVYNSREEAAKAVDKMIVKGLLPKK